MRTRSLIASSLTLLALAPRAHGYASRTLPHHDGVLLTVVGETTIEGVLDPEVADTLIKDIDAGWTDFRLVWDDTDICRLAYLDPTDRSAPDSMGVTFRCRVDGSAPSPQQWEAGMLVITGRESAFQVWECAAR